METYLIYYGIFCLTTAIASVINLLLPVLSRIEKEQPDNVLVDNKTLTCLVFTGMAALVAPALLIPTLSSSSKFKDSLFNSVKD